MSCGDQRLTLDPAGEEGAHFFSDLAVGRWPRAFLDRFALSPRSEFERAPADRCLRPWADLTGPVFGLAVAPCCRSAGCRARHQASALAASLDRRTRLRQAAGGVHRLAVVGRGHPYSGHETPGMRARGRCPCGLCHCRIRRGPAWRSDLRARSSRRGATAEHPEGPLSAARLVPYLVPGAATGTPAAAWAVRAVAVPGPSGGVPDSRLRAGRWPE